MARGKKITYTQRALLSEAGVDNTNDWEYLRQVSQDEAGFRCMSRNEPKHIYQVFRNKITGEEKRIEVIS